jgi:hypothetical protein
MPAHASNANPTGVPVNDVGTAATVASSRAFHSAALHRSPARFRWIAKVAANTDRKHRGTVTGNATTVKSGRFQRLSTTISARAASGSNNIRRRGGGGGSGPEPSTAGTGASGGSTSGMTVGGGAEGGFTGEYFA